jgi:hypothetical protein
MTKPARFHVDPKLATLLGEGYRSSELALKELIDNAWDADASSVIVSLPEPLTGEPIVIRDNGSGMTAQEVQQDYLVIASDRTTRKGPITPGRRRPVKGRKGIGKFAGFMLADTMKLESRARGTLTRLVIRKQDLLAQARDLEAIDLPLEIDSCDPTEHGTTIFLSDLNQALDIPMAERLKPVLVLEYGRQDDFVLTVDGETVGVEDIPGESFTEESLLPGVGRVQMQFTISDGKRPLRQSGIAVRVTGKVIGKPGCFDLENDDEVPRRLLKRVYGELEADGLANDVTADWGAVIENSTAYSTVTAWAEAILKGALSRVFSNEIQLARARRTQEINRRLEQLPEHRRPFAEARIQRVLSKFFGEKEDRIDTVVSVALDAIEFDEYYVVVKSIDDAQAAEVAVFADALDAFGLVDMAVMADQARRRLELLDRLDCLFSNPSTREQEIHKALEHNLWVLGSEYALLSSNKTLSSVIGQYSAEKFKGARATRRPDLLLLSGVTGRHVLIEFKRPSMDITREHEAQAIQYRDDLRTRFESIEILVIGRGRATGADPGFSDKRLTVTSYAAVVSRARNELSWLLEQLTSEQRPSVRL